MGSQRPILYLALAFVLFLIWQAWVEDYQSPVPTPAQRDAGETSEASDFQAGPATSEEPGELQADANAEFPEDLPSPGGPAAPPSSDKDQDSAKEYVHVKTEHLIVDIALKGGDIRRVALPTYPVSTDKPDTPVQLLDDRGETYIAQSGLIPASASSGGGRERAPDHYANYAAYQSNYTMQQDDETLRVPLVWESRDGVRVTKAFVFHADSFHVDIEYKVENRSDTLWEGRQYQQIRHGPEQNDGNNAFIRTFTGFAYYDESFNKVKFDKLEKESLSQTIEGGWVASLEHYFISAWIPDQQKRHLYYSKTIDSGLVPNYIIGVTSTPMSVAPGQSGVLGTRFYAGPKIQENLEELATGLDLTVDYGIFSFISRPLFEALQFSHSLTGNWGFAIILVTILIKLVFYYPSKVSYQSMAKMRALQPRMQELKERYADDKSQMNQALMDMYKKEKVNPLGGCLPILIQIPVFIALYWVLIESVELRQAPFILWIDDLSVRDPYFVLPLIMGASMFIQQYLNPAPLDPIQQKVMMVLPVVFTVFFMFFPAGLVLYWVVNNTLSIAQQWQITRKVEKATR